MKELFNQKKCIVAFIDIRNRGRMFVPTRWTAQVQEIQNNKSAVSNARNENSYKELHWLDCADYSA